MKRLFPAVVFMATSLAGMAQTTPEEKLNMTMYAVMNLYVDSVDKAKFVDYQISNMMKSLDPFSEYLPPVSAKQGEMIFGDHSLKESLKQYSIRPTPRLRLHAV